MTKVAGISSSLVQNAPRSAPFLSLAAHLGRGMQRVAKDPVVDRVRSLPRKAANVYFRNGKAALLDWQDRQASEHEFLDAYCLALPAGGGPELDRDELWDRYRQAALYAYVAPLITAGTGGMQEGGIAVEGLKRGVAALDTVALLRKAL